MYETAYCCGQVGSFWLEASVFDLKSKCDLCWKHHVICTELSYILEDVKPESLTHSYILAIILYDTASQL